MALQRTSMTSAWVQTTHKLSTPWTPVTRSTGMFTVLFPSTKRHAMVEMALKQRLTACTPVMVCSVGLFMLRDAQLCLAHGQEWLLRANTIAYRTLGGSFDLYFLSGQKEDGSSSALTTISQFQVGCIGTPAMQVSALPSANLS